jgi:hypothetical protein
MTYDSLDTFAVRQSTIPRTFCSYNFLTAPPAVHAAGLSMVMDKRA